MSTVDVINGMTGSTDNVMYLAQEISLNPENVNLGDKKFNIVIPESWKRISRIIAILAVVIWIAYAAWQFLNTKNQGRGLQRVGGFWPLVAAGIAAAMFWEPQNIVSFGNFLLNIGTGLLSLFTNIFEG